MIKGIINFIQASFGFDVPAREAIRHFESKGLKPSFSYLDVTAEEHRTAFTVAKMMDMDLLQDMQDSIRQALKQGWTYEQWADRMIPHLQANGWWGHQSVVDPLTGKTVVAELGSARRLQIIFRNNMQMAYSVGRWEQIMRQAEDAPYLMYDAVDDFRTRPKHRAWDNTILPVVHVFWRQHYPPNGWGCRCNVIQLSASELEALGLSVTDAPKITMVDWTNPRTGRRERIPDGVDAGFAYNAGQARYDELQRLAREKAAAIEGQAMREAAEEGLLKSEMAAKRLESPPVETFSVYDAAVPKVAPDTSTPLKVAVVEAEDEIRKNTNETAIIFDGDGTTLLRKTGEPDNVQFTEDETKLMKNRVVTHNHPQGTSFSVPDVLMAIDHDIGELRVVGEMFRYSVKASNGWPSKIALNAALESIKPKVSKKVATMIHDGAITPQFTLHEALHYTWVEIAATFALIYEREKS